MAQPDDDLVRVRARVRVRVRARARIRVRARARARVRVRLGVTVGVRARLLGLEWHSVWPLPLPMRIAVPSASTWWGADDVRGMAWCGAVRCGAVWRGVAR